ncbi:MAG: PQQ-binding-like beta-propeller repeat protein, partial [Planctomycetes bacterium]|nr:PQQ-binding-like beta-propeller repeat protein [Planctomycetota bacterium]
MKKTLAVTVVTAILTASVVGQDVRLMTRPSLPPREVLNRLNLSVGWKAKLPTDGMRDGFYSLQIIPGKKSPQIVAQTFSGAVSLLDAETGDVLWRTPVGTPYWPGKPVGFNDSNLFVVRRNVLYVLNRATGSQRVYAVDKETKLPDYGLKLEFGPSAAPAADEYQLFFVMGDRVLCYNLPDWDAFEKGTLPPAEKDKELTKDERQDLLEKRSALAPQLHWSTLSTGLFFEQPPLVSADQVSAFSTSGHVLSFDRGTGKDRFDFQAGGNVPGGVGQHNGNAYFGSEDFTLYALNMKGGQLAWRFLSGAPIRLQPQVTDKDVFVVSGRRGLFRLDR